MPQPAPVPRQAPSPYADELLPERELAMAGAGARSRTAEMPAMGHIQFLGAPVQLDGHRPPAWDYDDDADELFDDDETQQVPRAFGGGRRVAAIATPALVLGMVGALAVSLLTGHGPKFDQLSSHQTNPPLGTGLAAAAFPTYPELVQRGVFESVNRIVASGGTLVATAQRTVGSSTSQQFFVSRDGGASWQLAPVHGNPTEVAPLLAGGPGGWLAIGPQSIWTSHDGRAWTLAAEHGVSQVPGDQIWVVTKTATGFLAGGSDAQSRGVVWISPDGLNWHRQVIGSNVRNIAYATAHGNDILVTGALASGSSGAWLSGNGGSSWRPVKIPGPGVIAGVAWNGNGFLAVRDDKALFSPNGITWHSAGTIGGSGGLRPQVVKGGSDGFVVPARTAPVSSSHTSAPITEPPGGRRQNSEMRQPSPSSARPWRLAKTSSPSAPRPQQRSASSRCSSTPTAARSIRSRCPARSHRSWRLPHWPRPAPSRSPWAALTATRRSGGRPVAVPGPWSPGLASSAPPGSLD